MLSRVVSDNGKKLRLQTKKNLSSIIQLKAYRRSRELDSSTFQSHAMADYTQATRPMLVSTPLGTDKLLLVGFEGTEQISGLFSFQLDLIATNATKINFDKLLGEGMVVAIETVGENPDDNEPTYRYFSGICCRFSQGNRDKEFTSYQAEIAPHFWLATRTMQSRMFQQMSVPEILKKIFKDLGMKVDYQLTALLRSGSIASSIKRPISISPAASWRRRGSSIFSSTPRTGT